MPAAVPLRNLAISGVTGTATIVGAFVNQDGIQLTYDSAKTLSEVTLTFPTTGESFSYAFSQLYSSYKIPLSATGFVGTISGSAIYIGSGGDPALAASSTNGIFTGMVPDGTGAYETIQAGFCLLGNAAALQGGSGSSSGGGGGAITSPVDSLGNLKVIASAAYKTFSTPTSAQTITTAASALTTQSGSPVTNRLGVVIGNTGSSDAWIGTSSGSTMWNSPSGGTVYIPAGAGVTLYAKTLSGTAALTACEYGI